ncbi:hypothetical protein B0A55_04075 [Friedmanniomyces simplex]|uniref:PX domain-containing protein n=1 Tax=Friedmanniomyces simplex TaxID=329884 RepID=A0A4U0XST0_9PEZI|nr:hypothetical protein B0A55_04075 [Friedmanniomyces simplex]
MDEGGSPWDDVPSRSHSNHSLAKTAQQAEAETDQQTPAKSSPEASSPRSSSGAKPAPSKSRTPRRYGNLAQSTTLESLDDDSMGPLGPLGAEASEEPSAPAPPVKELASRSRAGPGRPSTSASAGASSLRSQDDAGDDGAPTSRTTQHPTRQPQQPPSLPIEQASKPTFSISVGDPHTVGNAANSHTVYTVLTTTTSRAYNTPGPFTVTRRYRDFLWLYDRLHDNSPGIIIPPPPEKQAVGRFEAQFVESRRMALERMLNKIAAHPVLQHDGDLKVFLESESFNLDIKHKDRARDPLLLAGESKGFMSSIGISTSSGSGGKFIEHDDWFHDRRIYLDALEIQLKALQKSTEIVVAQRRGLADTCGDFSASLHNLAAVELSPPSPDP